MKKGTLIEGTVEKVVFPNKGIITLEDGKTVTVKNAVPGQKLRVLITKKRSGRYEGQVVEILEKSSLEQKEAGCACFGICGGCTYQNLSYETQLKLKETQVYELLSPVVTDTGENWFLPAKESPKHFAYRNKMEYTFGNERKDGPLTLGMHKRGSFHDIVDVSDCKIVDEDFCMILRATQEFFAKEGVPFYHRMRHDGYLRHLLVRRAEKTKEILIDLVTTSEKAVGVNAVSTKELLLKYRDMICTLPLSGSIKGILHTQNDCVADTITDEGTEILYGESFFYEELLQLRFRISPFSFFQTNSLGAEVLYETARSFIEETQSIEGKVVFDLYSGTGTIAQMLAPVAKSVVGVEIVPEAVEAAKQNAAENGLSNCTFLAGDVLKVLDEITQKPDFIVLDPPRDGVHPKALSKIIHYGVEHILYISCKPTSLARDLEVLQAGGYRVKKAQCVDMFPFTANIETVILLSRKAPDAEIKVRLDMSELDITSAESKATYKEIREYVQNKYDLHVTNL